MKPWQEGYRLVSLWEMLSEYAYAFSRLTATMMEAVAFCDSPKSGDRLSMNTVSAWIQGLTEIEEPCTRLSLTFSWAKMNEIRLTLQMCLTRGGTLPTSWLASELREAKSRIVDELAAKQFLYVPAERAEIFSRQLPFGKAVSIAFSDCTEDIAAAHRCLALGTSTAAMFHLGRAMEIAVKLAAKRMRVTLPKRDEWQHYINAMNEVIAKMPFKDPKAKAKRAVYSAVSAYLFNFKEAWRNQTMHPKKTYTQEEAASLIAGAGDFLRYAAAHLFNVKV